MTDNVVTLAGKPAGISDEDARFLREQVEWAITHGAHVLLMTTFPAGTLTGCRTYLVHANGGNIPVSTFYRDAYRAAHSLLMNGEQDLE